MVETDPVMTNPVRRGAKCGFSAGLWAGLVFLIAEMLTAIAMRGAPVMPSPEGLARALSKALERIVTVSTPAIHRAALGATVAATNSSAE